MSEAQERPETQQRAERPASQRCLFISTVRDNRLEREQVIGQLQAQGVDVTVHEWQSIEHFQYTFQQDAGYDLLYLSSHADDTGFGENPWDNPWDEFATAVCVSDCMLPEATLFLACCRGGMKTVALNLLSVCNKIDYIVGPEWKAKGADISNAFRAYCECCYTRKDGTKEPPCCIEKELTKAAGQTFACYDRVALECDLEIFRRLRSIDEQVYSNFRLLDAIKQQNEKIMEALGIFKVGEGKG